jgi:hypothetical protein
MKKNKLLKTLAIALAASSFGMLAPNSLLTKAHAESNGYWQQASSNWYYKDRTTGSVETGWIQDNGYWYYLNSDGVMQTGWVYDSGNWYYLYSDGIMATDTTIDGYYLSSTGAWTTTNNSTSSNSESALTWEDVYGKNLPRGDISQSQDDVNLSNTLTSYNIDMSSDEQRWLKNLAMDLSNQKLSIDEARSNCIGKTVNGKYRITDIKFFDQSFPTSTENNQTGTIKSSSLSTYNSSSTYKYDAYLVFSCGNARSNQWEATRTVIELETL